MTEEDAKVKIVVPWLVERGVNPRDLSFETSFRVRIGRQEINVGSAEKRASDTAAGRLDMLVSREGRNLVVVELKRPGSELTDKDRDQAISYARLVHPIAPLSLVTNGDNYRLFDTITKERLKADTHIRDGFGVSLPSADRLEALEIFLSLSPANLLSFCRLQAAEQLRPLVGSAADLSKVYIPELHVERRELHAQLQEFLGDTKTSAFVLLGDSGAGKTSSLCHAVGQLLERGQPVLFFRGLTIEGRLLDVVAEEFDWTFGDDQSPAALVKRIDAISPTHPLLIAVDAIEQWGYSEAVANLYTVLRQLRGRSCKLVLSCKTAAWDVFVHRLGSDTGVADYVFSPQTPNRSAAAGYILPPMSDTEFHWAVMNYRSVFNFHGFFEEQAITEARRNPYLLRVFFDVARNHDLPNLALSSRQLLDEYYKRLLARTSDPERADVTLLAAARAILHENQVSVSRDTLRRDLGLGVNDSLMSDLFDQNLLEIDRADHTRDPQITFYSEPLRNFLIAYRVLRLPSLIGAEFSRVAGNAVGVEASAFAYYLPQASVAQQREIAGLLYSAAEQYLQFYRTMIETHFSGLRASFEPRGHGAIGFVTELMLPVPRVGYFGFRAIRPSDAEVLFIPVGDFRPSVEALFAYGVNQGRMNSSFETGILRNVSKAVMRHEIEPQLRRILAHGELNESNAPELSRELLRGVIAANARIFAEFIDSYTHQPRYPIALAAIENAVRRACLYEHFDHIRCENQRRSGRVPERRDGQFVSYSWQPSVEDREWIEQQVAQILPHKSEPQHLLASVNSQCLLERVRTAVRLLGADEALDAPPFRVAGGPPLSHAWDRLRMDPAALTDAFAEFYKAYLDAYQEVVSASFPTLKAAFPLYAQLPVHVLVAVSHPYHWEQRSYPVTIAICPPREGQNTNEVIAINPAEISHDAQHRPLLNGEPLDFLNYVSSDLGSELRSYPSFLPNVLQASDLILRCKVYGKIESEIDTALAALSAINASGF